MAECYICKRALPPQMCYSIGGAPREDEWHMTNPARHAAAHAGPVTMVPVCNKCEAPPVFTLPPAAANLPQRVAALERIAPNVPPIFHHLFALLPPPGADFPAENRLAFLRALAGVADVVYGPAPMKIEKTADPKAGG